MSAEAEARKPQQGTIGFNLAAIMLVLALLGVGAAYLLDAAGRAARTQAHRLDTETTLTRTLGGRDLQIPLSWFRYEEQRVEGFAKQIDLRFELPLGVAGKREAVEVTLLPRSRARPSAALLDGVYLHQFLPEQVSGPPGLVGKPLNPDEGYAGETVWYDPLSADPFVAKCSKPVAATGAGQCLRTVYLGPGIAAIYAFPEAALTHWRDFDGLLTARLGQIGAL
ncbi:MAG: hypothetical protein JWQ89_2318 [Devosia sp.]|uniref:hypothetical protein n=1 Tax=Devosia sp. TaxID=1871048 RepID=UPI0026121D7E|nr:hypothetical protein [Devosia sp.]MDB5540591.1 hypothetical protein [Devosia sp.]